MPLNDNFSTLFELLPIGAYRTDAQSRQQRANRAMVRIFGFDTEEEMLATTKSHTEGWYAQPGRRAEFRALLEARGWVRDFVSEMPEGLDGPISQGGRPFIRRQLARLPGSALITSL